MSYVLFLRDQEKIEMYSIGIEEKNGISKIYQPELQGTFVKQHLWSNWDPETSILSYISKKSSFFTLTSCSFQDITRPSILYEQEEYLNIPSEISYGSYPWINGHKSSNTNIRFTLLHFNQNILLCQQLLKQNSNDIEIVIFVLHLKLKHTFTLPIHTEEELKVVFTNLNDLLLIYIPGYFLKILDCNKQINDILTWKNEKQQQQGEEMNELSKMNQLSIKDKSIDSFFIPFLPDHSKSVPILFFPNENQNSILDLWKGFLYDFDFNLEIFFQWFKKEISIKKLTNSFYFVINFIKQKENESSLIQKMIFNLIERNLLSHEILIEYLLSNF